MKKNILIKGILVLVVIAFLSLAFTGCYTPPPTTGTVYLTIGGFYTWGYTYDIYLDSTYLGFTSTSSYTITNVPPGWHYIGAYEYWTNWPWDQIYVYISAGANYITISPY